ncbi:MAG TPA: molybdopterin-binding/glycosyltransferase family 2 protein [Acetobacteraceae bacterium]|nr:molybdopterin-binding/glycosyltransferase family 2 protein [Acetobacteraceae bacterium]
MIFGRVPAREAAGGMLAHSARVKSRLIPKGTVLDEAAIAALISAGFSHVTVARLEEGDVPEADAARELGDLLAGPGLRCSAPVHGRVNLFATAAGLLRLDAAAIAAINLLDEAITLGTLADAAPVAAGEMIGTLKIVPFAVPAVTMAAVRNLLDQGAPLLTVRPFRHLRVGLVLSRLPHLKDAAIRHTIEATRARVAGRGGTLLESIETAHETAPIAAAIRALRLQGAELILVAGASAVTDRLDVAPAAIVEAGGEVTRFGMPVDPGNLICFGSLDGGTPAIILPGCARSPKLNGIDFVLDRAFAGEALTSALIARMGVGGLLKDFSPRPDSRAALRAAPVTKAAPRIAAIILAAGRSSRAAPANKLLARLPDGRTMIETTVDHARAARIGAVVVVTGHDVESVRAALAGRDVTFVHAPDFAEGMAHSIRAGIAALPEDIGAALICLGDMPLVSAPMLDRLIGAYDPDEGRAIVVPAHRGRRGNPVLWDRRFFPTLSHLEGDAGARRILSANLELVAEVEMESNAVLLDFDTADAITALQESQSLKEMP